MSATTSFKYNKGDRKVKDLYADLLEVIEPYLSDFTGYDEEEQAFNIVQAVKELLSEFNIKNERLKEENYQLQKDCQICENFIDFIPCKPIRDMDYNLQKVINQRDKYIQTLQEIKAIAKASSPYIDNIEIKSATEVGYDYAAICNELEKRLHKVLEFITKAESEG